MGKAVATATVVLAVNGKRYEAAGVDPSTTLLEFLRTQTPVRGPKLGCGEGTCPPSPCSCILVCYSFCLCLRRLIRS
jgi:xanthine dehydrogenase iron-sulfur cluster and FAD-binding subunit A